MRSARWPAPPWWASIASGAIWAMWRGPGRWRCCRCNRFRGGDRRGRRPHRALGPLGRVRSAPAARSAPSRTTPSAACGPTADRRGARRRARPGGSPQAPQTTASRVRNLGTRWTSRPLPGWLKRLAVIGFSSSDSEELRVRKTVLVLSSTLMASLSFVWVATYAALGLWVSAAIPLGYQVASAISIYVFARTRRYLLFRRSQLWMSLLLPFALQWSLGGFTTSSAVSLWAFTAPLGALLFVGARQAVPWFLTFVALVGVSGV